MPDVTRPARLATKLAALLIACAAPALAGELQVVATQPAANAGNV